MNGGMQQTNSYSALLPFVSYHSEVSVSFDTHSAKYPILAPNAWEQEIWTRYGDVPMWARAWHAENRGEECDMMTHALA